jgi:hypothetical protein
MRELAGRFPAILPVRFGTVMAEDELRFTLSSRRAGFVRALAHVRNRVQMTVRVVTGQDRRTTGGAGHPLSGASRDSGSQTGAGREYLTARARQAAAARVVPGFDPVRESVSRWVRDERVDHRAGVSSVYHLIPGSVVDRYRRAAEMAAAAAGLRITLTGPWPPYAFGMSV